MKITDVECIGLIYKTKKASYNAIGKSTQRPCLVVKIYTDEGIVGIGEAATYGGPMSTTAMVIKNEIAPKIIGEDPLDVERIWGKCYNSAYQHSRGGIFTCALSGVDMALWDIKGKKYKTPIYKLLGGYTNKIQVYASGGFYGIDKNQQDVANELKSYVDLGFKAVKMKVGRTYTPITPRLLSPGEDECTISFEDDINRVKCVREAVGDNVKLMVDANAAWTFPDALKAGRIYDDLNVYLFEEPVRTDDYEGSKRLAEALDVRIAGYETEVLLSNYKRLIDNRSIDVIQPDLSWAGGFTECRKIAAYAEANFMECAAHTFSSGILLAASLQFSCGIPNGAMVEYDMTENGLREEILAEPFEVENGFITLDDSKFGLGIELKDDVVEKYKVEL